MKGEKVQIKSQRERERGRNQTQLSHQHHGLPEQLRAHISSNLLHLLRYTPKSKPFHLYSHQIQWNSPMCLCFSLLSTLDAGKKALHNHGDGQ